MPRIWANKDMLAGAVWAGCMGRPLQRPGALSGVVGEGLPAAAGRWFAHSGIPFRAPECDSVCSARSHLIPCAYPVAFAFCSDHRACPSISKVSASTSYLALTGLFHRPKRGDVWSRTERSERPCWETGGEGCALVVKLGQPTPRPQLVYAPVFPPTPVAWIRAMYMPLRGRRHPIHLL